MVLELDARRPISSIEADSSSAAAATVWTPAEACSEAAAAAFDRCAVSSAVPDMAWAVTWRSVEAEIRVSTMHRALVSKASDLWLRALRPVGRECCGDRGGTAG